MKIDRTKTKEEYLKSLFYLQQRLKDYEKLNNKEEIRKTYASMNYSCENLDNESWVDGGSGYTKYQFSSKGRVKYNGLIVPQKNFVDKDNRIHEGYLVLDKDKYIERYKDITDSYIDQNTYVYRLIASAFLNKIENDGFDVHHITNDGYDNSIDNLVLLTPVEHSIVHGFKIGDWKQVFE